MIYPEEDYLQISGLQHFKFCRRQWALIHIENQWAENWRTAEGVIMHEKAHNPMWKERRGDLLITRDMHVFSSALGISGACDVVEFRRSEAGVPLHGQEGLYQPFPVEYKRGSPRTDTANALQLCAQAMCLEEMLCCDISEGALYYGETRRRETVKLTGELRQEVRDFFMLSPLLPPCMSHPVWGGWIEIMEILRLSKLLKSHPVWGGWIEIGCVILSFAPS